MISSLLSLIYANLRASWRKYILTELGIAIAAFFLSAVLLLNTIISATYVEHYGNQVRNSDAVVAYQHLRASQGELVRRSFG